MTPPERAADALVAGLLQRLGRRLDPASVDELWVFPTRRSGTVESTLLVVSTFEEEGDRRRILTARAVARRDARGGVELRQDLVEQGVAPPDRVVRLLEGVLRRLDDALTVDPPRTFEIGGESERWREAVRELTGEDPAPPAAGEGEGAEDVAHL